jgi:hypothetical protein
MKLGCFLIIGAAIVCASCKSAPPAQPETRVVKVDSTNITEAQKAGYKIVNKDGKNLYCRRDLQTGSHLRYTTACLTEEEWRSLQDMSRRGVEEMMRRQPPVQGK